MLFIITLFASLLAVFSCGFAPSVWALEEKDFVQLSTGGFGDSANSYAWGVTEFNGDVYVSTNRHHAWGILQGLGVILPLGDIDIDFIAPEGPSSEIWGDQIWARKCGEKFGVIERVKAGQRFTRQSSYWENFLLQKILPYPRPRILLSMVTIPRPMDIGLWVPIMDISMRLGIGPWVPNMPLGQHPTISQWGSRDLGRCFRCNSNSN